MAPTKSTPARRTTRATAIADPKPEPELADDGVVDVEAPARPRVGDRVLVAVHPDRHDGRDDVAPADVTRVVEDDDGEFTLNLRVHYDAAGETGWLSGVPFYPDRAAFEEAEAAAYQLLPGHRRRGDRIEPGENHITQAPWRTEDVRLWQTGAWPISAGE